MRSIESTTRLLRVASSIRGCRATLVLAFLTLVASPAQAGLILTLNASGDWPGQGFIELADGTLDEDGVFPLTEPLVEDFLLEFPDFQTFLPIDLQFSPAMNYEVQGGKLVGIDIHAVFALTSAFWELQAFDPDPSRALSFGTTVKDGLTRLPGVGFEKFDVAVSVSEPATMFALLGGMLGAVLARIQRKKRAQVVRSV